MSVRVTKLERAEHGEWEANLHVGEQHVHVTREDGSWMVVDSERRFELLYPFAALVQQKVKRIERREQRS